MGDMDGRRTPDFTGSADGVLVDGTVSMVGGNGCRFDSGDLVGCRTYRGDNGIPVWKLHLHRCAPTASAGCCPTGYSVRMVAHRGGSSRCGRTHSKP